MRSYQVVIAATRDMGLGIDMKLPWDLPNEYKFFQQVTRNTLDPLKRNATIMGRKSWESTPDEIRPLPGRLNVVLTRSMCHDIATNENVLVCASFVSALELLATAPYSLSIETVFLIGGGEVLRHYMNAPTCEAIHLTEIDISVPCDAFAPKVDTTLYHPWYSSFPLVENGIKYSFNTYIQRKDHTETKQYSFLPKMVFERHEEFGYSKLIRNIISNGDMSNDNNTLSKFGSQMRFNLRKTFPLLKTKKILWQSVVEEILQLINGSNNPKEEGTNHTKNNNDARLVWQEFNQVYDVINKIKNNPRDRRIVMISSCNPSDCKLSVYPCKTFAQFYVANGELSCQIYQSSIEASLRVPFSIAVYSLLTCIIAHVCDLVVGDFIHVIGDAYVNIDHINSIRKHLQFSPKPFPILKLSHEKTKIDQFEAADIELMEI